MAMAKHVASVFLDTNIIKFSAVKHHVYRPHKQTVKWGPIVDEVDVYEPHTVNRLDKIQNDTLRKDAVLIAMAAYAGVIGKLRFCYHRETEYETRGLRGTNSASGKFFGCPIHDVPDPTGPYSRILSGGSKGFRECTLDFLSGISDKRYRRICRSVGAYQGKDRPLNLNQALDAFYIWCAECANIDYMMTMDYKLRKIVTQSKLDTPVRIITPYQILLDVVPKFGVFGAVGFMWNGFRFAKEKIGFREGKGWS